MFILSQSINYFMSSTAFISTVIRIFLSLLFENSSLYYLLIVQNVDTLNLLGQLRMSGKIGRF